MSFWLFLGSGSSNFERFQTLLSDWALQQDQLYCTSISDLTQVDDLAENESLVANGVDFIILSNIDGLEKTVETKLGKPSGVFNLFDVDGIVEQLSEVSSVSQNEISESIKSLVQQLETKNGYPITPEGVSSVSAATGMSSLLLSEVLSGDARSLVGLMIVDELIGQYRMHGKLSAEVISSLRQVFGCAASVIADLEAINHNVDVSIKHKDLMLDQKREEIAMLRSQVEGGASVDSEKELLQLQIEQLESELEDAYKQAENAQERSGSIAALSSENRGLAEQVRQLKEQYSESEEALEKLKVLVPELRSRLAVSESQLAEQQDKYVPIKSYCDEMEAQLTSYERELDSLKASNAQLAERLTEAEVRVVETTKLKDGECKDLEAVNTVFKSQTEIFRAEVKALLREKEMVNGMSSLTRIEDVFSKVKISGLSILSGYSGDGYEDLKLNCASLELGDQRFFKKLNFKLALKGGNPGLEFRPDDANEDHLHWFDFCNDEYGYYLPYFPNEAGQTDEQHNRVIESMTAADRLLVLSVASNLAHALQSADLDVRSEMSPAELRKWRLAALELKERLAHESHWMSHEAVYVEEEYTVPGYQHLWLSIDHLLHGKRYFKKFDFKVAVPKGAGESLESNYVLEFRQLLSGDAPFFAWPTDTADDAGSFLKVNVAVSEGVATIDAPVNLTSSDEALIETLVMNVRFFFARLSDEGVSLGRDSSEWQSLLSSYGSCVWSDEPSVEYSSATSEETPEVESSNSVDEPSLNNFGFSLQEVYEDDGYSHVAFVATHPDRGDVVVKYQLKYVGDDLDGWVEFRSACGGELGLPFDHVEEGSEDEYGRAISLRYIHLHESEHTDRLCAAASENDVALLNNVKHMAQTIADYVDTENREAWTAKFW